MTAVIAALTLLTPNPGQVGPTFYPTLESLMCSSKAVYRGSIVELRRRVAVPPGGTRNRSTYPDGFAKYDITIRIDEVLKGAAEKTLRITEETLAPDRRFEAYQDAKTEFLLFKDLKTRFGTEPIRLLRIGPATKADEGWKPEAVPIFSMTLKPLRTTNEVLAAARSFKEQARAACKVESFSIPYRLAFMVAPPGDGAYIELPVIARIATMGLQLIEHPERFLDPPPLPRTGSTESLTQGYRADLNLLRRLGVHLLMPHRSDAHIKGLLDLLSSKESYEENGKTVYPVRDHAKQVLDAWGVVGTP